MEVVEGLGGVSDGGVRTRRWEKEAEKDWGEGVGRSGKKRWKNMGKRCLKFSKKEFLRRLFEFQEVVNNVWKRE